jgi:cytochrome b6-f complex iron-sulfur subunit
MLTWLIRGFLSLWGLGAAGLGIMYLRAPDVERRTGAGQVRCGALSSLPVGEARLIQHGSDALFVYRASDSEVLALSAVCTHLRCILRWDRPSQTFVCPCHAGVFDRAGNVISGLPSRPLTQYRVEIRAGEIMVRT